MSALRERRLAAIRARHRGEDAPPTKISKSARNHQYAVISH